MQLLAPILFASSVALAQLTEEAWPFQAPQPGDLRSPCPALNAAANHGILPRNGRDIDLEMLGAAVRLAYNMTYDAMLVVGEPGLTTSTTGNASTFHLSDLAQHEPQAVEHDGSLTREDAYFGRGKPIQNDFSWKAWGRALDSWGNASIVDVSTYLPYLPTYLLSRGRPSDPSSLGQPPQMHVLKAPPKPHQYISIPLLLIATIHSNNSPHQFRVAATELKARFDYGMQFNPEFNATFARTGALLQYGLMMSTFGNTLTGDGNVSLIRYWIEKERLPLEFGWQPSKSELNLPENSLLAGNISEIWDEL